MSSNGEEEDKQSAGSGDRWNMEELEEMEFVCTFLENDDDVLPDFFDTKKVQRKTMD